MSYTFGMANIHTRLIHLFLVPHIIIRTNVELLSIGPPETNFSEIWIGILSFSLKKMIWICRLPEFNFTAVVLFFTNKNRTSINNMQHTQRALMGLFQYQRLGNSRMMTSSNGNIFRVTGPLCGEFTGPGEFPTQRPVTRSFYVFFDVRLIKRLSKHSRGWWFETLSHPLWRHRYGLGLRHG